ncbi:MAG: DNA alkylation repair protein [Spirochaetia bacterium]
MKAKTSTAERVRAELESLATSDAEAIARKERFFKAVPGGYGEGDRFLAVSVPEQRRVAKAYWREASLSDVEVLLDCAFHEVRAVGLFIMVRMFEAAEDGSAERGASGRETAASEAAEDGGAGDGGLRAGIFTAYTHYIDRVNNWDLVDSSAPHILGAYLYERPAERGLLYEWSHSGHLWRQRAAVVATFTFIRRGRFDETIALAEILLSHEHDLIHKAVGWMLREIGNRAPEVEYAFLDDYAAVMPRTMLRYAVEKVPEARRRYYMSL